MKHLKLMLAALLFIGCVDPEQKAEETPPEPATQTQQWSQGPQDSRDHDYLMWMAMHRMMTPSTLPSHHDEHHGFSAPPRHYTPVNPHYAPLPHTPSKPAYRSSYSSPTRSAPVSRPYRSQSRFYRSSSFSSRRR